MSAPSATDKEKLELCLSASAMVLPQPASGAGRGVCGSYRLRGRQFYGSDLSWSQLQGAELSARPAGAGVCWKVRSLGVCSKRWLIFMLG